MLRNIFVSIVGSITLFLSIVALEFIESSLLSRILWQRSIFIDYIIEWTLPPFLGGLVVGWIAKKRSIWLAYLILLPLLLEIAVAKWLLSLWEGEIVHLDLLLRTLESMVISGIVFLPLGGFIGKKLYSKLHKEEVNL